MPALVGNFTVHTHRPRQHPRMPICRVRRHAMFVPVDRREPGGQRVIAVYDEEWDPDEWGDPGQFVRRRLVTIEGPGAPGMMTRLDKEAGGHWTLRPEEPAGPVEWAEG